MDNINPISPFTFIVWKEDENAIVVGTKDPSFGYGALMQIDGIDINEIVDYAKNQNGQKSWENELARKFPFYVSAVAGNKGVPCFVTTKRAAIEYSNLQTNEVLEAELEATEDAYHEAVRIEVGRAEYDKTQAKGRKTSSSGDTSGEGERGKPNADDDDSDEENPYGGIDKGEAAILLKRFMLGRISTQIEAAISIAAGLGLTNEEIKEAYGSALGPSEVPQTFEEYMKVAEGNSALMKYLEDFRDDKQGRCRFQ